MKFEYSVLEAEDIDEAYALEAECFSRPWKRKDFEDAVENSGLYLFMKARGDDGSYAAQAGLIISYDTADITNVAVASCFRRQGIAAALLRRLMEAGRERGVKYFTLEVRSLNEPAIRLYESLGFAKEGTRKGFYRDPEDDALIMWKRDE